jgi:octaprenyl-diphosphate synthase
MEELSIDGIWKYYGEDLRMAEDKINETLKPVEPAISAVGNHICSAGGKRIRPFLSILCARLFGVRGNEVSTLASSVEFIHAASLIHDDVVDGASLRRGQPSAHSIWGNQVVVLVGDFLYSNALRLANLLQKQRVMDALCSATAKMSEGELIQLSKKGDPGITEEEYMKIIQGKTAILMSAACSGGAVLGGATEEEEEALAGFGLKFGFAFQIADDILDYAAEEKVLGKTLGKDLEEGKITLPLLYLLRQAEDSEVKRIKEVIKSESLTKEGLADVQSLLRKHKSIEKCYERAHELISEAKAGLCVFSESMEKNSLHTIADYVLKRRK